MQIELDRGAPVPVYAQIRDAVLRQIESGRLLPGSKLPSSRALAGMLSVHRSTVIAAYKDLEASGLLESGVGQGTFVRDRHGSADPDRRANGTGWLPPGERTRPAGPDRGVEVDPFNWDAHLARHGRSLGGNLTRPVVTGAEEPGAVSFQRAIPDPTLYPERELREVITRILSRGDRALYDYGPPAGHEPLRQVIRTRLEARGVDLRNDEILIVNGSQQALHLVAALLLDRGSSLMVENPTFAGALDLFKMRQANIMSAPMDAAGLAVGALAEDLRGLRPRMIYTIPTFHNPTGITLSPERRCRLVELAAREQIPILEDDWLGELRAPRDPPPIKAHDRGGRVIMLSTFSKVVVPGLRVGWLVAPRPAFEALCALKARFDICTNALGQAALHELARTGELDRQIDRIRAVYAARLATVLDAIDRHLPAEVTATRPAGGITLWISLPRELDPLRVVEQARREGVLLSPGHLFTPEGTAVRGFRICFSTTAEREIERGISTLGRVIKNGLRRARRPPSHSESPPLV